MAFYDFLQKLILARQIQFDRGRIILLGQNLSIFPTSVFPAITDRNPKAIEDVYKATKASAQLFGSKIRKEHEFTSQELKSWLKDIVELAGWGEAEFTIFDEKRFKSTVRVRNSSIAANTTQKGFADHALRGFFAGGGTASMGKEIDCVEIKCAAKGDKICEFRLAPKEVLEKEFPDLVKTQLWWLQSGSKRGTGKTSS